MRATQCYLIWTKFMAKYSMYGENSMCILKMFSCVTISIFFGGNKRRQKLHEIKWLYDVKSVLIRILKQRFKHVGDTNTPNEVKQFSDIKQMTGRNRVTAETYEVNSLNVLRQPTNHVFAHSLLILLEWTEIVVKTQINYKCNTLSAQTAAVTSMQSRAYWATRFHMLLIYHT